MKENFGEIPPKAEKPEEFSLFLEYRKDLEIIINAKQDALDERKKFLAEQSAVLEEMRHAGVSDPGVVSQSEEVLKMVRLDIAWLETEIENGRRMMDKLLENDEKTAEMFKRESPSRQDN